MKKLLFVITMFAPCAVFSQNILSFTNNTLRPDSINGIVIPYVDYEIEGENVIWDLSETDTEDSDTTCISLYEFDDRMLWDESGSLTTYRYNADTLLITRVETPQYEMDFSEPLVAMVYPFQYGKSVSKRFSGRGMHEGKLALVEDGTCQVSADAYGTLVLPSGDTLRNVLRVHTSRVSSVDISYRKVDNTIGVLNKTANIYEWYARGYRYPVLRTREIILAKDGSLLRVMRSSSIVTPDSQRGLDDPENEEIRSRDSIMVAGSDIIEYDVVVNGSTATITYELKTDAHVSMTLADSRAIVYWRYENDEQAGGGKQVEVPLGGLRRGQYIIYINVNGVLNAAKINVS